MTETYYPFVMCFFRCMERCEEVGVWYLAEESVGLVHIHLENIKDK